MMNKKWYFTTTSIIFTVMGIAHLALIILPLPASYAGMEIPLWFNGAVVIICGYLATRGFMAAAKL